MSSERSACEALRSKRNAVLRSAMMEQVKLPLLSARESQASVTRSSTASSDGDSNAMEVEEAPLSQGFSQGLSQGLTQGLSQGLTQRLTQHFSQSQATAVQSDQEEVERIDFSMLGDARPVSETEYGARDDQYRERITKLATEIDRMSPNMLAEQKFKDITEKVSLINQDRKELIANYNEANEAFKKCCERRKEAFLQAYEQVESVIDTTYKDLTRTLQFTTGGQALLALTNPEEPYLGGVKYTVSPVGKQYRDIGQLSGGEKTIATLALLFALHNYRRAPFFIMDEIDDALDNANVERVAKYVEENCRRIQCIIISHKDLLFERSDSLVGVYHNWEEASSSILTIDLRKYDSAEEQHE